MAKFIKGINRRSRDSHKQDYYATDPIAIDILLKQESFSKVVYEPAVGEGHLAKRLEELNHEVIGSDLIDRNYKNTKVQSVFDINQFNHDIITNPPYKIAKEFIEHCIKHSDKGTKIAMFLKLTFLESKSRKEFFENYPPKTVYVSRSRIICAKNGNFEDYKSSTVAYAWYVWEVGYGGETILKWVN